MCPKNILVLINQNMHSEMKRLHLSKGVTIKNDPEDPKCAVCTIWKQQFHGELRIEQPLYRPKGLHLLIINSHCWDPNI